MDVILEKPMGDYIGTRQSKKKKTNLSIGRKWNVRRCPVYLVYWKDPR